MKIKTLCIAMAVFTATAHYANAADGKLTFQGNITNSSCTLSSGESSTITVPMGSIPKSVFEGGNKSGPQVGFRISLTNCDAGTYYLIIDGATVDGEDNILALDDAGSDTTGVGIKITDTSNKAVTISKKFESSDASITIGEQGGAGAFLLKANYQAIADTVEPGVANATAHFTIVQQ